MSKPEEFEIYCEGRGRHGHLDLYRVWLRDGKLVSTRGHRRAPPTALFQGPHDPKDIKMAREQGGLWAFDAPNSTDYYEGRWRWRLDCPKCHPEGHRNGRRLGHEKFASQVEHEHSQGQGGLDVSLLLR